jgi:hypothetical protein
VDSRDSLPAPSRQKKPSTPEIISLQTLMQKKFAPIRWAIQGILPEGAIVLGGKPKLGKSTLAFSLALAVASGGKALGKVPVEQGQVLYLDLENGQRRIQDRARQSLQGEPIPSGFDVATTWPRLDDGGDQWLRSYLADHPDCRIVVVDTLKKIRPRPQRNVQLYDADYDALDMLHQIAEEYRVCILIIHHTRKANADDFIEELSGSNGLSGAVDGIMVLQRDRGKADAVLKITGRDVGETEYALQSTYPTWELLGDAGELRLSDERKAVLEAIRAGKSSPKAIFGYITEHIDPSVTYQAIKDRLFKMREAGLVKSTDGSYSICTEGYPGYPDYSSYPSYPGYPGSTDSHIDSLDSLEKKEAIPHSPDTSAVNSVFDSLDSLDSQRVQNDTGIPDSADPPALPDGYTLVMCDHHGKPSRYGVYFLVQTPDGQDSEAFRYKDQALTWARLDAAQHPQEPPQ